MKKFLKCDTGDLVFFLCCHEAFSRFSMSSYTLLFTDDGQSLLQMDRFIFKALGHSVLLSDFGEKAL
jgi:hypothetical protein